MGLVVSQVSKLDLEYTPAHRDNAMNGAQLLMAHGNSSGLMNVAPAFVDSQLFAK